MSSREEEKGGLMGREEFGRDSMSGEAPNAVRRVCVCVKRGGMGDEGDRGNRGIPVQRGLLVVRACLDRPLRGGHGGKQILSGSPRPEAFHGR